MRHLLSVYFQRLLQGSKRHFYLFVSRFFSRHSLQPESGEQHGFDQRIFSMSGTEVDELVAKGRNHGNEQDTGQHHQPQRRPADQRENQDSNHQYHKEKAGATAYVGFVVFFYDFNFQRNPMFIGVHHLVLGAVIGEDTLDVRQQANQFQVGNEDGQPDGAFN